MESIATRLARLRKARGLTQSKLGALAKVSQGTIGNIESGLRGYGESIVDIASALGVTPDYLRGETDDEASPSTVGTDGSAVTALHDEEAPPEGYVQIKESEVRFTGGDGHIVHYDELQESVPATYRSEWFRREQINPANCKRFKVDGHSMENTLFNGDTVLVNLTELQVVDGKVYAIRYGDKLRIKRLYKKLDGGLILHSDNPEHRPRDEELLPDAVEEHISIIGRVRDKSGAGGL